MTDALRRADINSQRVTPSFYSLRISGRLALTRQEGFTPPRVDRANFSDNYCSPCWAFNGYWERVADVRQPCDDVVRWPKTTQFHANLGKFSGRSTSDRTETEYKKLRNSSSAADFAEGTVHIGGRSLTYLQVGDPSGPLVIHNHGGPSSRIEAKVFASHAFNLGLRFVCVDRPGQGKSDPQLDRTFASWAADLEAIANAFEIDRFAVTGWSEGGPWALAAAAYLDPAKLIHVASIAPASYGAFGANWAAKHLSSADAMGGFLALHFRPGFQLMYDLIDIAATRFPEQYKAALLKASCPADLAALADADVLNAIVESGRECFRQGADGLVTDARMLYQQWPFDVTAIQRPVHLWQGSADKFVPYAVNKPLGERMPGAVWHEIADGGHFIATSHAAEILTIAANDLAATL